MTTHSTEEDLLRRLKTLSERLWEERCALPDIEAWLGNFSGRHCEGAEEERLHALHLLASVSYFGLREIRVLLRSMFRDLYRYPLVQELRDELKGSRDGAEIQRRFEAELRETRFIGMGNPAESGTHLLYYFRQENRLPKSQFVHQHQLLTSAVTDPDADFAPSSLRRVVFIDDLCASGEQSVRYSRTLIRDLRDVAVRRGTHIQFQYLVLFGTAEGLTRARTESDFELVAAVCELDSTYRTFGGESRVFRRPPAGIEMSTSERLASGYGSELWREWPLGYGDQQLLLAFHHNVPDNSLPILWSEAGNPPWVAAFPRHPKVD